VDEMLDRFASALIFVSSNASFSIKYFIQHWKIIWMMPLYYILANCKDKRR